MLKFIRKYFNIIYTTILTFTNIKGITNVPWWVVMLPTVVSIIIALFGLLLIVVLSTMYAVNKDNIDKDLFKELLK